MSRKANCAKDKKNWGGGFSKVYSGAENKNTFLASWEAR